MNESKDKDIAALENIKTRIEAMGKSHHIEILKILHNNPAVTLNENKSGVYVNLTFLPDDALNQIQEYLGYVEDQESSLDLMENQKSDFRKTFFDNM